MTIDHINDNPIRTLPAGDYIIGDLCYFLHDAVYQQLVVRGNEGSRVVTCTIDDQPIELYASFIVLCMVMVRITTICTKSIQLTPEF